MDEVCFFSQFVLTLYLIESKVTLHQQWIFEAFDS